MAIIRTLEWKVKIWAYYCGSPESVTYKPDDWHYEYFDEIDDEFDTSLIVWSDYAREELRNIMIDAFNIEDKRSLCYKIEDYGSEVSEEIYEEIPIEIPVEIPIEIPIEILKTWPYAGIPTAYSPTLDKFINKSVYDDIKMCARPEWHIYGITKLECHQRLREHGIDAKNTDILTKEFKISDLVNISQRTRDKIDLLQQRINKTKNVKVKKILTDEISAILIGLGISKEDVMNIMKIK